MTLTDYLETGNKHKNSLTFASSERTRPFEGTLPPAALRSASESSLSPPPLPRPTLPFPAPGPDRPVREGPAFPRC